MKKFLGLTRAVTSETRVQQILATVLSLDTLRLLTDPVANPLT